MSSFLDNLEKFPTGKIRIIITLFLISGTGILYLIVAQHGGTWEPSANWLVFLTALAGVDLTQYAAKSFTGIKYAKMNTSSDVSSSSDTDEPDSTATSDVSEIYNKNQKG